MKPARLGAVSYLNTKPLVRGLEARPDHVVVRRWPNALPQLTVGHGARMAGVRSQLPQGIALAGASYDGVGLAACVRSGEAAATPRPSITSPVTVTVVTGGAAVPGTVRG